MNNLKLSFKIKMMINRTEIKMININIKYSTQIGSSKIMTNIKKVFELGLYEKML